MGSWEFLSSGVRSRLVFRMDAATTLPVHDPPLRCLHCGGPPHEHYDDGPLCLVGCPAIPEGFIFRYEYLTLALGRRSGRISLAAAFAPG